jgi:hypothetical protein
MKIILALVIMLFTIAMSSLSFINGQHVGMGTRGSCSISGVNSSPRCWGTYSSHDSSYSISHISAGPSYDCSILRNDSTSRCYPLINLVRYYAPGPTIQFKQLSTSNNMICGILLSNSTVKCYGEALDSPIISQINADTSSYLQMSALNHCFCGIQTNQTLKCIQCVVPVELENEKIAQVAISFVDNCVILLSTGTVKCWRGSIVITLPVEYSFVQLTVKNAEFCGILRDATVRCWRSDAVNSGITISYPSQIENIRFSQLGQGFDAFHICGIQTKDNLLYCWGENDRNQITPPPLIYSFIGLGETCGCGIININNYVKCWGSFQDGAGNIPNNIRFTQIATGSGGKGAWTCGILESNATLKCFGRPEVIDNIPTTAKFDYIASGEVGIGCGIFSSNKTVTCWDTGTFFNNNRSTPIGLQFKHVSIGGAHVCGILLNSSVVCWGCDDTYDTNCNIKFHSPPITTLFSDISAGTTVVCGLIKDTGYVSCWGVIENGISTIESMAPINVAMSHIAVTTNSACALRNKTGIVQCWGTGSTVPLPTVGVLFSSVTVGNGPFYCGTDQKDGGLYCFGEPTNGKTTPPRESFVDQLPAIGYYQRGVTVLPCPLGTYSNAAGSITPMCSGLCDASRYGNTPSTRPDCTGICPLAHYCPIGTAQPLLCPAGVYGDVTGLSTIGCSRTCPLGFFCPPGSIDPYSNPCAAGKFGGTTGLTNESCSGNCSAGYFCPQSSTKATQIACRPGEYSLYGAAICSECGVGKFSTGASSNCSSCLSGYYTAGTGSSGCSECPGSSVWCPLNNTVGGPIKVMKQNYLGDNNNQ